jgi:hypothetical protein
MRTSKLAVIAIICGVLGLGLSVASAQDGSGSAVAEPAGSAAPAPAAEQPKPADALANPVDDPVEAYSDLKAAKKQGWAFAILAGLIMLAAAVGRAAVKWPSWPVLSWINKHKKVLIVSAAIGVTGTAAFNAMSLGGSWLAVIGAGGGALLAFINAAPSEAKS